MAKDVLDRLFFSEKPKPQPKPEVKEDAAYREMETSGQCYDHHAPLVEGGTKDMGDFLYKVYRCPVTGCKREIYAQPMRR